LQVISESTLLAVAAVVALAFGLALPHYSQLSFLDFDKKMNKEGAIAGMIIGFAIDAFLYV
jgi:cation/acetate symporter